MREEYSNERGSVSSTAAPSTSERTSSRMDTSDVTTKTCARCKDTLPKTSEFFPRNRAEKDGLASYCKPCHRLNTDEWRIKHNVKLQRVDLPDTLRQCNVCKKAKPATREFFTSHKMGRNGLQSFCKECGAEIQRTYRQEHPDTVRANERNRDPDKRRQANQKQYQRNGKHLRKLYCERHPERVRASAQKQRAKRKQATGEYTGQDLLLLFKGQGGNCWWCGCKIKGKFEVDHVIPLSRGGANDISNIVVSCVTCNRSKHNKLPGEWNGRLL